MKTVNAYQAAIKLLTKKDYSKFTLLQKVMAKGFSESEAEDAIERLKEERLFSEEFYIDAKIRGMARKVYGVRYIQQKLEQEEISLSYDEIETTLRNAKVNLQKNLEEKIESKLLHIQPQDHRSTEKIIHQFQKRGFELDEIRNAILDIQSNL